MKNLYIATYLVFVTLLSLSPVLSKEVWDCPKENRYVTSNLSLQHSLYVVPKIAHVLIVENPKLWQKILKSCQQQGSKDEVYGRLGIGIGKDGKVKEIELYESFGSRRLETEVMNCLRTYQFCKPPLSYDPSYDPSYRRYRIVFAELEDNLKNYREYPIDYFVNLTTNRRISEQLVDPKIDNALK